MILFTFQISPFACSLYSCILCILCIYFVFVPYALTLPVSRLSYMSIKICSVLFCSVVVIDATTVPLVFRHFRLKNQGCHSDIHYN